LKKAAIQGDCCHFALIRLHGGVMQICCY